MTINTLIGLSRGVARLTGDDCGRVDRSRGKLRTRQTEPLEVVVVLQRLGSVGTAPVVDLNGRKIEPLINRTKHDSSGAGQLSLLLRPRYSGPSGNEAETDGDLVMLRPVGMRPHL